MFGSPSFAGMRANAQVLIYVDVPKAMAAGLKFYLSANDVVLTDGDEKGFIPPELFERVEFVAAHRVQPDPPKPGVQAPTLNGNS